MSGTKSQYDTFQSILEPWNHLVLNAPGVVGLRLSLLPWLWATEPVKAAGELQRMVTEKHEAWQETLIAMSLAPLQIGWDTWQASMTHSPQIAFNRAVINSSRRMARPASRRVRANRARLTRSRS